MTFLFSTLRRCFTRAAQSSQSSADCSSRRFRPRCEALEDRIVPTWAVSDLSAITPFAMAQSLVGAGVTISNVVYTGANAAAGHFTETSNAVGIKSGIVLSSGSAANVAGPNTSTSITTNGTASDANLNSIIAPTPGFDAAVLQFDWIPKGNVVDFKFVFGSDEYPVYVGGGYSDVFAFYLNGVNKTFIPGTTTPINIDTVNATSNSSDFVNNNPGPALPNYPVANPAHATGMFGYTTVLQASFIVNPGSTNHVKLAIEDAGDSLFDSWVLIKDSSLVSTPFPVYAPIRYTYDPLTRLYSGDFTVVNPAPVNVPGPLYLIFESLPYGVVLANSSGVTPSGKPYIKIPGGLHANSSLKIEAKFSDPFFENLGTFFVHGDVIVSNVLN